MAEWAWSCSIEVEELIELKDVEDVKDVKDVEDVKEVKDVKEVEDDDWSWDQSDKDVTVLNVSWVLYPVLLVS